MKIAYVVEDCRDKISPDCAKTFTRKVQRGRPQVNCEPCKTFKVPSPKAVAEKAVTEDGRTLERTCACGATFTFTVRRGAKPTKCAACREGKKVYRANAEGTMEEVRAETLRREQAEIAEQKGRDRADLLTQMMRPLLAKKHREVIVR